MYYKQVPCINLKNRLNQFINNTRYKADDFLLPIGIQDIKLNKTSAGYVQEKHGLAYDLFDINGYTYEMKYFLEDFSCLFRQDDEEMKIFALRFWKNSEPYIKHKKEINGLSTCLFSCVDVDFSLGEVFSVYQEDQEPQKNYDNTHYVKFSKFRYHFFQEDSDPPEFINIESITVLNS